MMIRHSTIWLLGLGAGFLLSLMINLNSLLAKHTTPLFASWVAHALGLFAAFCFVLLSLFRSQETGKLPIQKNPLRISRWLYLGGIPGSFTVILAAIAVNSSLRLSGTISFMLVGQILFGIFSDHFGFFGIPKRKIGRVDLLRVSLVLCGSLFIIFGSI
jgi:transporter family-2 protein